jgi:hypothetical protein
MSAEIRNRVEHVQRPEVNIASVEMGDVYSVDRANYPWISGSADVPTVKVKMVDGTEFRYGSIIGLSNGVEKIASEVPEAASNEAEDRLFAALPFVLQGQAHPAVDKVMNQYDTTDLLKVGRRGPDAARLIFDVHRDSDGQPVVMRVGISRHKDQMRLMGIISKNNPQRRRKHDGGGR